MKQTKPNPTIVQNVANKRLHFYKSDSFMSRRYKHHGENLSWVYLDIELYLVPLALQFQCTLSIQGHFLTIFTHETYYWPLQTAPLSCRRENRSQVRNERRRGETGTFRHNYAQNADANGTVGPKKYIE